MSSVRTLLKPACSKSASAAWWSVLTETVTGQAGYAASSCSAHAMSGCSSVHRVPAAPTFAACAAPFQRCAPRALSPRQSVSRSESSGAESVCDPAIPMSIRPVAAQASLRNHCDAGNATTPRLPQLTIGQVIERLPLVGGKVLNPTSSSGPTCTAHTGFQLHHATQRLEAHAIIQRAAPPCSRRRPAAQPSGHPARAHGGLPAP